MTMAEIAKAINALFRAYGLADDVVEVRPFGPVEELCFIDSADEGVMGLRLLTIMEVFRGYWEAYPATDQMRLF